MQVLQWLFKVAEEEQEKKTSTVDNKSDAKVKRAKPKDLVLSKRRPNTRKKEVDIGYKVSDSDSVTILLRRGNARACFSGSLNLKRLGSFRKRQYCMRTEEELEMGTKGEIAVHVGNRVLPISDATPTSTFTLTTYQCWPSQKNEEIKGDKIKTMSRMKELWRWAATAKSDSKGGKYIRKKVMHFRNRGSAKDSTLDDQWSLSSPKISFRWETDSCSNTTSVYSAISLPVSVSKNDRRSSKSCLKTVSVNTVALESRNKDKSTSSNRDSHESASGSGNWITTDDEFVVLEL